MFDVDRLKEALAWATQGEQPMPGSSLAVIFDAARLVVAGQPLWWCEVHKAERSSRNKCLTWYVLKALEYEPISTCRMVEGWWMPIGKDET